MASDVPFQTARSGGSREHKSPDHPVPKRTDTRERLQHAVMWKMSRSRKDTEHPRRMRLGQVETHD